MSPLAFTGWRFVLATAFLLAEALAPAGARSCRRPGARGLALVLALSGVGVYQWLYALGLASTSELLGGSPELGLAARRDAARRPPAAGSACRRSPSWARSSPGAASLSSSARPADPDLGSTAGNLMCLGAATSWAVYNVSSARSPPASSRLSARSSRPSGRDSVMVLAYTLPDMLRQDYRAV